MSSPSRCTTSSDPLDIVDGTTPELIIQPGDTLVGVGSVNIMTVVQSQGTNAPGDGPGTIVVNAPVVDLAGASYTVQIDGPINSCNINCTNGSGCGGMYSSTVVLGAGNTYTAAGTLAPAFTGMTGGTPAPTNTYIPPVTSSFVIVQAQGGVLGSFSGLTQPAAGVPGVSGGLPAGTRLDALYYNTGTLPASYNSATLPTGTASQYAQNPNAIALWVTPASYTNLFPFWNTALNQNQFQVGTARSTRFCAVRPA